MSEKETKTKRIISESQVPPHLLRKIKQQEEEIRKSQDEFIFLDKSDECAKNGDFEGAIDWLKKSININDTKEKRQKLYELEERLCQKNYVTNFHNGNISAAIEWLIKSINYTNTEQKRKELRELYMKQCKNDDPVDFGFREVINANIENGKLDYANYLKEAGRTADSIHWFVAAGKYEQAFQMVDIRDSEALKRAINDFQGQEDNYSRVLSVALHENDNVNKMFNYQKWPELLPIIAAGVIAFRFTDDLAMQIGLLLVPIGAYIFKNRQWDKYNDIWKQLTNTPVIHWQLEPLKAKFDKNEMEGIVPLAIIIVLFINVVSAIGGCLFSPSSEDEKKAPQQPAVSTESTQAPTVKEETTSQAKEPPFNANEFNLSLGDLKLGNSVDQMHKVLGAESKISNSQTAGHKNYEYKDVVVTIKDDSFIDGLVSYTDKVKTEKGLKQGSSLKEVLSTYGRECVLSEYDDTKLYEYPFETAKGNCAVLRFAIKNNIVDYTSLRLVDNDEKNKLLSNVKSVNDSTESTNNSNDINAAKQSFINYHKAITNKSYREAYDILSFAQRERIGDYDSYAAGFADTISSEVSNLNLISSEDGAYTFDYTLTARDRYQGNKVKVQTFKGQVTMAKDKGRWYVRYAKSSKTGERIE